MGFFAIFAGTRINASSASGRAAKMNPTIYRMRHTIPTTSVIAWGTRDERILVHAVRALPTVSRRIVEDGEKAMKCPTCEWKRKGLPPNEALPDHTCPYKSDINDDDVTLCNCCEDCRQECADDI